MTVSPSPPPSNPGVLASPAWPRVLPEYESRDEINHFRDAAQALQDAFPWRFFFARGRGLVLRTDGDIVLRDVDEGWLLVVLGMCVSFLKRKGKRWGREGPRGRLVRGLIRGAEILFPRIDRVVRVPYLYPVARPGAAQEVRLLDQPGYNPDLFVYLDPPDFPRDLSLSAARDTLYRLVRMFPFATPADRALALAVLFIPFTRLLYLLAPLLVILARGRRGTGSGKTAFAQVAGALPRGQAAPLFSYPANNSVEATYSFRAALSQVQETNSQDLILDDVPTSTQMGDSDLHMVLSAEAPVHLRLAKRSQTVAIDPRKMNLIATINDPDFDPEQLRRSMTTTLDPDLPRGEPLCHDPCCVGMSPMSQVINHWSYLIGCVYTVLREWVGAGCPRLDKPYPEQRGYEACMSTLGGIVMTLSGGWGANHWAPAYARPLTGLDRDLVHLCGAWPTVETDDGAVYQGLLTAQVLNVIDSLFVDIPVLAVATAAGKKGPAAQVTAARTGLAGGILTNWANDGRTIRGWRMKYRDQGRGTHRLRYYSPSWVGVDDDTTPDDPAAPPPGYEGPGPESSEPQDETPPVSVDAAGPATSTDEVVGSTCTTIDPIDPPAAGGDQGEQARAGTCARASAPARDRARDPSRGPSSLDMSTEFSGKGGDGTLPDPSRPLPPWVWKPPLPEDYPEILAAADQIVRDAAARGLRIDPDRWARGTEALARAYRIQGNLGGKAEAERALSQCSSLAAYSENVQQQAVLDPEHMVRPELDPECCTWTGRYTTRNSNVQGIARAMRWAVTPGEGQVLVEIDFRHSHPRLAAGVAGCGEMQTWFASGIDPYVALIRSANLNLPDKVAHKLGKVFVLAIMYRTGPKRLAQVAAKMGVPLDPDEGQARSRARAIRDRLRRRIPEWETFCRGLRGRADWLSPLGRRIVVPEDRYERDRDGVMRPRWPCVIAGVIQAIEADALRLAIARSPYRLADTGARLALPVHDNLLFEGPQETGVRAGEIGVVLMREALAWGCNPCPADVDVQVREAWGEPPDFLDHLLLVEA